jgi:hypothetical protein
MVSRQLGRLASASGVVRRQLRGKVDDVPQCWRVRQQPLDVGGGVHRRVTEVM